MLARDVVQRAGVEIAAGAAGAALGVRARIVRCDAGNARQEPWRAHRSRQVDGGEHRTLAHRHGVLDRVLQLAHVAGPVVAAEQRFRLGREPQRLAARSPRCAVQEERGQESHVACPLAQRRHLDLDDVQPIVEVVAELPLRDQRLKVAMRGRHDAHVHESRRVLSQAPHLVALERAQELHLCRERHVADLVQEQRAAVRFLHEPRSVGHRARERSAGITEQLALDQRFRQRPHVHRDERPLRSLGEDVQRARDQLLARAALAEDQDRAVRGCHARHELQEPLHPRARAEDRGQRQVRRGGLGPALAVRKGRRVRLARRALGRGDHHCSRCPRRHRFKMTRSRPRLNPGLSRSGLRLPRFWSARPA